MRRFGCDVTEDAFEGGHHEASLEPILINFPFLWVVVSQAVTQLRFSPHLLAKFEDVVPHQGDLLCLRSGSEHEFFQNVLGRQRSEGVPPVLHGLLPEPLWVLRRIFGVRNVTFQFRQAL